MAQVIRRGILQSFNSTAQTASILVPEATSTFLTNVPASTAITTGNATIGGYCAVLFFDEHNLNDAVVLAVYPNQ